jgi:hypothetical protein
MGRVKFELMTDGPDDELVPLPASQVMDNIRNCDLPMNSVERYEFLQNQLKELMNGINRKPNLPRA